MKKIQYILPIILTIALTACGSNNSADTQTAENALSGTVISETEQSDKNQLETDSEEKSQLADSKSETGQSEKEKTAADTSQSPSATVSGNEIAREGTLSAASDTASSATDENADALPEYTVTAFEESKPMHASISLNVRKGPSTDFEIVGSLKPGQEVNVTGQADTMWYEIQYGEDKAFVSNKYLQEEKPVEEPTPDANTETNQETPPAPETPQQEAAATEPVTEVKNVAGVILVGDSRFVQMQNCVGENPCTWIAESGKGYNWFNEKAIARIDSCVGKGSKILINLGVNDTGNLSKYISLVNAKADEWVSKGAVVYYASVNPVWENPYVTEEQVEYFNSQMQGSLNGNVHWIDSHSYLVSTGYKLVDGLHYSSETYQNIYAYYMSCL